MSEIPHSPLPWRVVSESREHKSSDWAFLRVCSLSGEVVRLPRVRGRADAAFIVRCVNSHAALLAALKAIVAADDVKSLAQLVDGLPAARTAIAEAEK